MNDPEHISSFVPGALNELIVKRNAQTRAKRLGVQLIETLTGAFIGRDPSTGRFVQLRRAI